MREVSYRSFGLIIAFLLPGVVGVWGLSVFSPTLQVWLSAVDSTPTIGGFLYTTLASLATGLTLNALRWAVIDTLHHRTGVPQPTWDFGQLRENFEAFDALVNYHYRYYQFYGSMAIGLLLPFFTHQFAPGDRPTTNGVMNWIALVGLETVFIAASRDALRKYYLRGSQLLAPEQEPERSRPMTNGADHGVNASEERRKKGIPAEKKPVKEAAGAATREPPAKKKQAAN